MHESLTYSGVHKKSAIAAGVAGISAVAITQAGAAEKPKGDEAELEKIKKLLLAHDDAMTKHDLKGALATLDDNAAVMGTGPGEMWQGKEELKVAYEHFFMVYDKGEQKYTPKFRVGGLTSEIGWLMTSGNVDGKRDGKEFSYPLNISLTVDKTGEDWKIIAMHFSTLTNDKGEKPSQEGTKS